MRKIFYATLLTLALCAAASAQTRRPAQTGATARPSTGTATKPAPTPATQQANASVAAAGAGSVDCGCEAGPLPDVLATVNGIKITQADFSPEVRQQIQELQQQVVDARKQMLDAQINSILLEAEAKKRGLTMQKLYEAEVTAKTVEPTQADAQAFFNQNKAQIEQQAGGAVDFNQVKDQVVAYMRQQRQEEQSKKFADSLRAAAGVKPTGEVKPPANEADRARVLATVSGKSITAGDIEDNVLPLIEQVQQQVYLLRKNDIDLRVNDVLLNQEAQKRSLTTRALLDSEVTSKVPTVTEAQAQDFYNKNKDKIQGDFPAVKYQLIEFLQQQEQQKIEGAFAQRLRNGASVQTFLTPPPPVVYKIATDDQPEKGNPKAAVTLVEFTDYQCPVCAQAQPVLERLISEYSDRVRFVVRDFPLTSIHADAEKAAEAAEAAREQGKYWDFTAILFHNQSALQPDKLKSYAQVLGLDRAKFDAALDSGKFADKVERDVNDGQKVGVNGTPTFFVNGRRVEDRSYEGLKAALDAALKAPAKP